MTAAQLIKSINVGRAKLGWDEDLYRDTLARFGGTPDGDGRVSLKSLSVAQMTQLLAHMRSSGFKQANRPANVNVPARAELTKVEALLTDMGKPWAYAEAILRGQTKGAKTKLTFASRDELADVIAALDRTNVHRLHQDLGTELQRHGMTWSDAGIAAALLFDFNARRDIKRYSQAMSQVLRWLRGELAPVCDWRGDCQ
jgi:phage gp16-like protein